MLQCLVRLYNGLGLYDRAVKAHAGHELAVSERQFFAGPGLRRHVESRNDLAKALVTVGRTSDAIPLFEQALKLNEAKLGRYHPDTLTSRSELADACGVRGRAGEAIRMHEQTLELCEANLGHDHPSAGANAQSYAGLLRSVSAKFERPFLITLRCTNPSPPRQAIEIVLAMRDLAEVYSRPALQPRPSPCS